MSSNSYRPLFSVLNATFSWAKAGEEVTQDLPCSGQGGAPIQVKQSSTFGRGDVPSGRRDDDEAHIYPLATAIREHYLELPRRKGSPPRNALLSGQYDHTEQAIFGAPPSQLPCQPEPSAAQDIWTADHPLNVRLNVQ